MGVKKLLIVSSTYPSHDKEKVPAFVKDQVHSFSNLDESLEIHVLVPHNRASQKFSYPRVSGNITEHRFHYCLPRLESLTDRGIMPELAANKLKYLLIPLLMFAEFLSLLRLALRIKPDLIYAHWFTPQAINSSNVSRLTRIPYVFTTHASDVNVWSKFGFLGKWIVRRHVKNARAITAVSTQTANRLLTFFDSAERKQIEAKTKIIPMGIYLPVKRPTKKIKGSVLFIGRLTEKKGLQYALSAIKLAIKDYPGLKVTVAGDGEMRPKLERQAKQLRLENNVKFVGFVSGKEKERLLGSSEIMIVPSIVTTSGDAEGLPVSLMEGLANDMICIATDVSGASDIITGNVSGLVIKQKDPEAITEALFKIMTLSSKHKESFIKEARQAAEKLDWNKIAALHLAFFNDKLDV